MKKTQKFSRGGDLAQETLEEDKTWNQKYGRLV
jgi:hypothetical protein